MSTDEVEDQPITSGMVRSHWIVVAAAVAVVLAVGSAYFWQRIDQAETRKDIEAINIRFNSTDKRIDESNSRLDRLETRADRHTDILGEIRTSVEVLKERTRPKEPGK